MSLNVLTLNIWGIFTSRDRKARITAIIEEIEKSTYDIICLQEVFMESDIKLFHEKLEKAKFYTVYFKNGFIGSGLFVATKFKILNKLFIQYPDIGHPLNFGGDYFAGKGIGYLQLDHPYGIVNVINTHLNSFYDIDSFEYIRASQLMFLSKFIKSHLQPNEAYIILGDFNCDSTDKTFLYLLKYCNLIDSFEKNSSLLTNTYGCGGNMYTSKLKPKRIDYILYNENLSCTEYENSFIFNTKYNLNYSDHSGISAHLKFLPHSYQNKNEQSEDFIFHEINMKEILQNGLKKISNNFYIIISFVTILFIVIILGLIHISIKNNTLYTLLIICSLLLVGMIPILIMDTVIRFQRKNVYQRLLEN